MLKFYNYLLSFDSLSPGPIFAHKGGSHYTTLLGLVFSLLSIALSMFSVSTDLKNFFMNENPRFINGKKFQYNEFNITNESLENFFQVQLFNTKSERFKTLTYKELEVLFTIEKSGKKKVHFPSILNMKVDKDGYHLQTHKNETINHLEQCEKEIFDNFHKHMEYGEYPYKEDYIADMKDSALCIPSYIKRTIFSYAVARESLAFDIFQDLYKSPKEKRKQNLNNFKLSKT